MDTQNPKTQPKEEALHTSLQQVAWNAPNHGAHIKNPRWVLAKNGSFNNHGI